MFCTIWRIFTRLKSYGILLLTVCFKNVFRRSIQHFNGPDEHAHFLSGKCVCRKMRKSRACSKNRRDCTQHISDCQGKTLDCRRMQHARCCLKNIKVKRLFIILSPLFNVLAITDLYWLITGEWTRLLVGHTQWH